MSTINIEEFSKVKIRIGTVLEATKVPDADRLIKLIFDFGPETEGRARLQGEAEDKGEPTPDSGQARMTGEEIATSQALRNDEGFTPLPELVGKYPGRDVRQVMSAIAPFYPDPSVLEGKQIAVCVNLEPRKFRGYESQGMIMATDNEEGVVLLVPEKTVKAGARIH